MARTHVSISGESFLIGGKPVYSEIAGSRSEAHGLLMNSRLIQGIFDDAADPGRFARFGRETWNPEKNTDDLIAALPEWYRYGLRAFTVGFQGGGPCFTTRNPTIDNNPYGADGTRLDEAYADRMDRLIRAADEIGMVVIVSFLYAGQIARLKDGRAVRRAVTGASRFLREGGYTNVLVEVANEYNVCRNRPLVCTAEGMASLMDLARDESGGLPVGCSGGGGHAEEEVCQASDYILIHGNGQTRQQYYNLIRRVRAWAPRRPVVNNEDSPCIGQLAVAYATRSSWGYYNNATKQEPPADWGVTPGEDTFFARRMAEGIGIGIDPLPREEQYYLQGFEPHATSGGKRWIRLASLYPETIDTVDFYRDGEKVYTSYVEPFSLFFRTGWIQDGVEIQASDREWSARVHLVGGEVIERKVAL